MVVASRREAMVKVENNKTMSTILPFFQILYQKQQNNFLGCFCCLKFVKRLYSNKLSSCICRSKRIVCTAEKVQQSISLRTSQLKSLSSMCRVFLDSAATAINYNSLSLWSITKLFFKILGTADSCNVLNYQRPPNQIENII